MKHTVDRTETGIRVTAFIDEDKQASLLEEFNKCAAGTCTCPTPQYAKLDAIDVQAQPGVVTVELMAKPGEVIDTGDIERCLDHTAKLVGG